MAITTANCISDLVLPLAFTKIPQAGETNGGSGVRQGTSELAAEGLWIRLCHGRPKAPSGRLSFKDLVPALGTLTDAATAAPPAKRLPRNMPETQSSPLPPRLAPHTEISDHIVNA